MLVVNSLCKNIFLIFFSKFPVFSLSGKMDFQIPCFPCAVATLFKLYEKLTADDGCVCMIMYKRNRCRFMMLIKFRLPQEEKDHT